MPNVALVLKEEITRLSRRELRRQLRTLKKVSAKARGHIAALRKQIAGLQREISDLRKRAFARSAEAATSTNPSKTRFVAKGLGKREAQTRLDAVRSRGSRPGRPTR